MQLVKQIREILYCTGALRSIPPDAYIHLIYVSVVASAAAYWLAGRLCTAPWPWPVRFTPHEGRGPCRRGCGCGCGCGWRCGCTGREQWAPADVAVAVVVAVTAAGRSCFFSGF